MELPHAITVLTEFTSQPDASELPFGAFSTLVIIYYMGMTAAAGATYLTRGGSTFACAYKTLQCDSDERL
jgi:hypothetical protein